MTVNSHTTSPDQLRERPGRQCLRTIAADQEESDTLGTDSGTLQTNLPRGGNPEVAAEATTGDMVAALLQYLIEKDERERQEKARSKSDR